MSISTKLRKAREKAGLTQEALSDKSGVTRSTIAMIETGKRKPSVNVAKELSYILGIDWTIFFD